MTYDLSSADPDYPYVSRRKVVYGDACVATSQPAAAQAGLAMFSAGGNAADAALATAITLTIVEPTMNGLGGDLFCMVHDGERLHGLNSSGRSPAGWTAERFEGLVTMPETGWETVTVPGQIAGWKALHERFCILPWGDHFEAAIRYARDGFLVPYVVARQWEAQVPKFSKSPDYKATFMPGGRAPRAGERFYHSDAVETLQALAKEGADSFYQGSLSQKIETHARAGGGALSQADLAEHCAEWVEPLAMKFRTVDVHELPPNGQGIAALIALGALDRLPVHDGSADEPLVTLRQIEAMRRARQLVDEHVADLDHMRLDPADLLSDARLSEIAESLKQPQFSPLAPAKASGSDTVYLAAADRDGLMVSLIQSNYHGFGSGIVVPGTGIALHNRGLGFVTNPSHVNAVGPRKRPLNTIIPGFLTQDSHPLAAFGVMGGGMQPQGHLQVVARMIEFGQNVQTAIDGPRWRLMDDTTLRVEHNFPDVTARHLSEFGFGVSRQALWSADFGAAQTIWKLDDGYVAGTESRRDGIVAAH